MTSSKVKTAILMLVLVVAAMLTSCSDTKKGEYNMPVTEKISTDEWQAISKKRIIFGHQSVGRNILSGVQSLAAEAGESLKLTESRSVATEFGITHFNIGKNGDPQSKIKDFEDTLKSGAVQGANIALMKLCYVDINSSTDAKKLAETYSSSLDRLRQQFPKTVFIAVTIPITTVQSGPKAWVKGLLGRELDGCAENFRRQEFNNILRNNFARQGRLFDLAKFESEGAGSHQYQGQPVEVMNPALTSDDGHLNAQGEQFVAAKFLKLIAASHSQP